MSPKRPIQSDEKLQVALESCCGHPLHEAVLKAAAREGDLDEISMECVEFVFFEDEKPLHSPTPHFLAAVGVVGHRRWYYYIDDFPSAEIEHGPVETKTIDDDELTADDIWTPSPDDSWDDVDCPEVMAAALDGATYERILLAE